MSKQNTILVGRRKESTARAYLIKGKGNILVNGKDYKQYFPIHYLQNQLEMPLKLAEGVDKYNIIIKARGGGVKGQAEASKLAIAKLLCEIDANFRPTLKKAGMLTRDARSVERKKFGLRKARKSTQFSKR